ncbi:MAG: GNAT family N-acetyltransferase [Propionibacteriaceae bacterium]|jgi:ribosomal-protein-serine acetyltransferase|nr:GNAT family N-acetyltransferase [Propionibacteriaceae bacterium]
MFEERITDHLSLRPATPLDAAEIFTVVDRNRDHFRTYLPWVDTTLTADDELGYLKSLGWSGTVTYLLTWDGAIIGSCGFHNLDLENHAAEIGYWIDQAYEGRGLMSAAVRCLERFAVEELRVERLVISAAEPNRKSRAIPERLGYQLEGILRQEHPLTDGSLVDRCIYSLLKPEWLSREA